jgi:CDP-diglyceride synthetase
MAIPLNGHNGKQNGRSQVPTPIGFDAIDLPESASWSNLAEEDLLNNDPTDGNNKRYLKPPYEYTDRIWHLGWTDGRYGQPSETNLNIIAASTALRAERELEELEQEIASAEGGLDSLKYGLSYLEPQLDIKRRLFDKIWLHRTNNRHVYSVWLAIIFFISAILLFAADIPLNLRLVASGFGIRTEITLEDGVQQSISNGLNLFAAPYFWEAILLATGLLFAGVYVKFFLDKLILREDDEQSPNKMVVGFLAATMLLFLSTLVILGLFRYEQQNILIKNKVITQVDADIQIARKKDKNYVVNQTARAAEIDAKYREQITLQSSWTATAFILLTILFPLIGGLCFSVSIRHFYYIWNFKGLKKDLAQTKNDFDAKILKRKELETGIRAKLAELEEKKNNQYKIKMQSELQKNLYLHGYLRGSKMKRTLEEGATLYERCQSLIENKLAEKSRELIWQDSPAGNEKT